MHVSVRARGALVQQVMQNQGIVSMILENHLEVKDVIALTSVCRMLHCLRGTITPKANVCTHVEKLSQVKVSNKVQKFNPRQNTSQVKIRKSQRTSVFSALHRDAK